jgi:hypothetical protein
LRVVLHVAAGGLGSEPFADVALVGIGARGEFGGSGGAGGEGFVETELFADDHHSGMHGGA